MTLQIGDLSPDFEAESTQGRIRFHDWIGNSWAVLFSHPKDFTPVCTTELGYMAKIAPEFTKRDVKIIGLSVDPVDSHAKWALDIKETQGFAPNYPMIGDPDLKISKLYGILPAAALGDASARTPADNQTVRNVFVIGPDKKIKLILVYPMTTGRNFDEVLRVIDSLQLTAKHRVATPVNWKQGEDVIISGSVSDAEAKQLFPQGWAAPKPYSGLSVNPAEELPENSCLVFCARREQRAGRLRHDTPALGLLTGIRCAWAALLSEFRSGGIGIRSHFPLVVAFSAANRSPLRRKML
jgi:alkyl hydroperoxide reductase subunit AhpC